MKRALLLIVFLLANPEIGLGGTHIANVVLYQLGKTPEGPVAPREIMAVTWNSYDIGHPAPTPPDLVMNKVILMRPMRGGGSLPSGDLGRIAGTSYGTALQQAYRLALKQTEDLLLNGVVEVNRTVFGTAAETVDDYAAAMTLSIMAMFRNQYIPETSIVVGKLDEDGRLRATPGLAQKVKVLKKVATKIVVPMEQLNDVNPLQYPGLQIEGVDTIDQAYQAVVHRW